MGSNSGMVAANGWEKPRNPYPVWVRRLVRRALPARLYNHLFGRHDEESLRLWRHLAASLGHEAAVLDIGAFVGAYSLAAREANPHSRIFAFEPNPHSAVQLRNRCRGADVLVEELAFTDHTGQSLFQCGSANSKLIEGELGGAPQEDGESVLVECTTLDDWLSTRSLKPLLLKIDTEGGEAAVIRGARKAIEQFEPMMLCEVLTDHAGRELMEALPDDYLFYQVRESSGLFPRNEVLRTEWKSLNWLAVPESARDILSAYDRLRG